ncbi:hypothetical protein Rsub_08525 [Raphidocelis subcapitata]|uniref:N-acetyltransferase domain-containing protein n=1 Tax=Raphidocelis subcapitata TaxID=307507 RepID=A0A2V0P6P7_9CHLO|nr:hypothetical protein Rsub_08525 [Raphidocelis subcapitata]|eukprot:GBF95544.1 hypothetical protein Rsub_08525 [Raphidocelis subcapitata]
MTGDYEPLTPGSLFFRPPSIDDLDTIHGIEVSPGVFLVASSSGAGGGGDEIVGYVCGTRSDAGSLTQESMARHDPGGPLLCIHSVCVAEPHRRRGVATKLLRAYIGYVAATSPDVTQIRLICKEATVPLYRGVGFRLVGPSPVVHGADPWLEFAFEMGGADGGGAE